MRGDMAPRNDRSIRNIPVGSIRRNAHPTRFEAEEYEEESPMPPRRPKRKKGSRIFILSAIGVAVVFAVAGLLLSTLFVGASVTVHPRVAELPATATIAAQPNAPAGMLSYATITISSSATTSVAASGTQKVSRQASGTITITNSFSADSQRLIANTRFEAPDGKIYRIHDSVTIPGMKDATPGTVVAIVYADAAGDSYNRGATHFTIPGFKGDPRYEKFYADAASISGGYIGNEPAVAASDLAAAKTAMEERLKEAVRSAIAGQLPSGFLIVDNSFQYTFSDVRQTPDQSGKANVSETVTATAAGVRASDLAAALAAQSVQGYDGSAVAFSDPSQITLSTTDKPVGKITIEVSGLSNIVWQYDSAAFKAALVGKKKDLFESVVTSFRPALTGAEATVRPFWQSSFPSDPNKITVTAEPKK
jgi:hypothetical protein